MISLKDILVSDIASCYGVIGTPSYCSYTDDEWCKIFRNNLPHPSHHNLWRKIFNLLKNQYRFRRESVDGFSSDKDAFDLTYTILSRLWNRNHIFSQVNVRILDYAFPSDELLLKKTGVMKFNSIYTIWDTVSIDLTHLYNNHILSFHHIEVAKNGEILLAIKKT